MDLRPQLRTALIFLVPTGMAVSPWLILPATAGYILVSGPHRRMPYPQLPVLIAAVTVLAAVIHLEFANAITFAVTITAGTLLLHQFYVRFDGRDRVPFLLGSVVMLLVNLGISLEQVHSGTSTQATGVYHHANLLGAMAGMALLTLIAGRSWAANATARWIISGGIPVGVLLLIYAASRGALLGTVAGALVMTVILLLAKRSPRGVAWRRLSAGLLLGLGGFMILSIIAPGLTPFTERFQSLESLAEPSGRPLLWSVAAEMIADRPALGFGPDGFTRHVTHYEPLIRTDRTGHAHNLYLQVALESGLLAAVALCAFFIVFAALFVKRGLEGNSSALLGLGCLTCVAITNLTDVLLLQAPVLAYWWITLSIGAGPQVDHSAAKSP